jgi:hypothetical protein
MIINTHASLAPESKILSRVMQDEKSTRDVTWPLATAISEYMSRIELDETWMANIVEGCEHLSSASSSV